MKSIPLATLLLSAFVAAANAQTNHPDFPLPSYEGWWGHTPEGCLDREDNQFREAWGRIQTPRPGVISFGKGSEKYLNYDGRCELTNKRRIGLHRIEFAAKCIQEGERSSGKIVIQFEGNDRMKVFHYRGNASGNLVHRCRREDW